MSRRSSRACCWILLAVPLLLGAPAGRAQEKSLFEARVLDTFQARCIGPANMGGRIVELAVVEKTPDVFYVAAATGGIWKTTDAGESWTPLLDDRTCSIGALAVSQANPDVVWAGTGEANPRNSVTWGHGVYKSVDGGKSWQFMGLKDTQHIGRIAIHPKNSDVVYVAALGRLWGANPERGLFKTTDGGKTWQHVLALDADTGCIDVVLDPDEPDTLYAAAYRVRRDGYSGGNPATQLGPKAGLYKSDDGGKSWERLSKGLPEGPYGRCGLAVYRKDPKVVYAVIQTAKTPATTQGQLPNKELGVELGGVFRSDDRGASWKQVNTLCPRPFYYGQIRVDPSDDLRVYVLGVGFFFSSDGGRKFQPGAKGPHPDHHALWINPNDPKHLILGNDGGLYVSKSRGATWTALRGMPLGQFYAITVDNRRPYRVYGGLQDNGSWGGPSRTSFEEGITLADWKRVAGADGFYCQVDPDDPDTVYAEAQYGRPTRVNLKTGKAKAIQPKSADKAEPFRFNWNTPMLLSPHNGKTLYYGGNYLFRSDDRGDTWKKVSPNLTHGKAGTAYTSTGHTLTAVAESPRKQGLLYTGSDDGRIHVSKDGGQSWTDVSDKVPGVPAKRWITRLECSPHDEATAYLTIGRHRNDDHRPYVFKTTDYGATWQSIVANLPEDGPVHVIRASSRNPQLLFVGTEHALFASLDGGRQWHRLRAGLPVVPIHDLAIHPRERDLVIGTHGRSVWVLDIAPLEELTPKVLASPAYLFAPRAAVAYALQKAAAPAKVKGYAAANPPVGASIAYHVNDAAPQGATVTIAGADGKELARLKGSGAAGLQRVFWDLRPGGDMAAHVPAGEYRVQIEIGAQRLAQKLRVESAEE